MSYQHFAEFPPSKNNHVYSNVKFTMVLFFPDKTMQSQTDCTEFCSKIPWLMHDLSMANISNESSDGFSLKGAEIPTL